jgi:steroid delta-isomerase-like uncharacterized protein
MDAQKLKQISKEWHEAFGTEALKNNYDKYLHDDFVADFFGGQKVNKRKYIEEDQRFALAFKNNKISVVEQIAEENKVVSIMSWTAVQIADLPDLPSAGKSFEVKGIAIDYFKDGKVIKHFPLFDQLNMMQQLSGGRVEVSKTDVRDTARPRTI